MPRKGRSGEQKTSDKGPGKDEADGEVLITTRGVTKRFDKVVALKDVSLEIPRGATGILGPNGAGKSTLIRIIIGLLEATAGSGKVLGRDMETQGLDIRRRIGYMPEHDCLILEMNAVELCTYMGELVGMSKVDAMQRAHEVLHFLAVGEERYRKIGTYSTGMKQKIKLAQALVHDPEIIFLDEPTNGLDPKGREEMLGLVKALAVEEGKNILFSSHLLPDVERTCENVVILSGGQVLKQGNIERMLIANRTVLTVKVKGEERCISAFRDRLSDMGFEIELGKAGQARLDAGDEDRLGEAYRAIMMAGAETGCQIRYVSQSAQTLEDFFLEAVRASGEVD